MRQEPRHKSRPGSSGESLRPQARASERRGHDSVVLFGWHCVKAALSNPQRKIRALYLTENAARRLALAGIALPANVHVVRPQVIAAKLPPTSVHQGLLAEAAPLPALALADLPRHGIALVLDQITDPHNVGAILRTAAAFAVSAVITTVRHSPEATGVLAKAACGALELLPLLAVPNLAQGLATMKEMGFFLVGLDSEGASELATTPLRSPLALVVGAEARGLRELTRQRCDVVAKLTLPGAIKTLNVSNATALALYVARNRLAGAPR